MQRPWNRADRQRIKPRPGRTVLEKFLHVCADLKSNAVCLDEQMGVITYRQMRRAVIALADRVCDDPEQNIGIMMPASAGAFIAYFAVLLAGKTPVMVNWSLGYASIESCMQLAGVRHVITAKRVVEHVRQANGEEHADFADFVYMEELRQHLSWWDRMRVGLYDLLPVSWLKRIFKVEKQNEKDVAVLLFTSGTESLSKAVPLTHENLLSNQNACLLFFDPKENDVMLSYLPPFHAYGFNSCSLFPLLSGMPLVFAYNPLQPKKVLDSIQRGRPTMLGSTPLFFDYLIKTARKHGSSQDLLRSLRLAVIGGDTLQDSLRETVKREYSHIVLHQGYGTTECSPVITISGKSSPEVSSCVGAPIEGMEVAILEENTHRRLPVGEVGLVVTRGTSLFSGYLHADPNQGFIQLDGERWYVTGDLGCLDSQGELFLRGRLSRFVKIGGEMVGLESIEKALLQGLESVLENQEGVPLVVCGVPGDKMKLCLFTTFSIACSEVNRVLKRMKMGNIMTISYQHTLDTIPTLGTGKPDYRYLNTLACSLVRKHCGESDDD